MPHPLLWMVTAEVVVVGTLLAFAWHLYQSRGIGQLPVPGSEVTVPADRHRPAAGPGRTPAGPAPTPTQIPAKGHPPPAGSPGSLLPVDLSRLNRDQAALERAQSSVVIRLTAALRDYLERVVLPAVLRAERASTATNPATRQSTPAIRKMP